jgi:hypothetical protein
MSNGYAAVSRRIKKKNQTKLKKAKERLIFSTALLVEDAEFFKLICQKNSQM